MENSTERTLAVAVLDDDPRICDLLGRVLRSDGYRPRVMAGRQDLLDAIETQAVHAVILDLGLPDDDGIDIAREVRRRSDMPLLMLTGRGDVGDRLAGGARPPPRGESPAAISRGLPTARRARPGGVRGKVLGPSPRRRRGSARPGAYRVGCPTRRSGR